MVGLLFVTRGPIQFYEFDSQNYGFAMQRKSDIDEEVNQALLIVRKTPEWRAEVLKYPGE